MRIENEMGWPECVINGLNWLADMRASSAESVAERSPEETFGGLKRDGYIAVLRAEERAFRKAAMKFGKSNVRPWPLSMKRVARLLTKPS